MKEQVFKYGPEKKIIITTIGEEPQTNSEQDNWSKSQTKPVENIVLTRDQIFKISREYAID